MINTYVDPKKVGARLRELRGIKTRVGVAREIGINTSSLEMYESGRQMPRDPVKCMIANYYGVPVSEIFFETK